MTPSTPVVLLHGLATSSARTWGENGWLDRLPDGPVDAVGFSLGARLLLGLAIAQPQRFRRIVTLGVGRNLFERSGSDVVANAIKAGTAPENPAAAYFARLADHPENDREALIASLQAPMRLLTA